MTGETIIVAIIGFLILAGLVRGVIQTFKRQPVVAIILMIVAIPIYLLWAFIEPLFWMAGRSSAQKEETHEQKLERHYKEYLNSRVKL